MEKSKKKKGLKTEKKIIDAAIKCVGSYGLHQTTFQKIADISKMSQPLVMHYFKKKEDVFPKLWNHVYQTALDKTSTNLNIQKNPVDKIKEYILVSWEIFNSDESLTKIYLQLFALSAFDDHLKSINTQVKRTAINRIAGIIIEGQTQGIFSKQINPFHHAKIIHIAISGFILNGISENNEFQYSELLAEFTELVLKSLQ